MSKQYRPIASSSEKPEIRSAALLKEVMRHSRSVVNTPSLMLLKMRAAIF